MPNRKNKYLADPNPYVSYSIAYDGQVCNSCGKEIPLAYSYYCVIYTTGVVNIAHCCAFGLDKAVEVANTLRQKNNYE